LAHARHSARELWKLNRRRKERVAEVNTDWHGEKKKKKRSVCRSSFSKGGVKGNGGGESNSGASKKGPW